MKKMRWVLVAAALCLAVISPLAAPAYAWGGNNQYGCPNGYTCPNPYQYANQYPYPGQYQSPNQYPSVYVYRYPNQYPYYAGGQPPPPPPPPPPRPPTYQPYFVPGQPPLLYPPIYVVSGLTTAYGNYSRCQQFALHQASCFMPDASNSPNLGSIQMEPGITLWGICSPGQTMTLSSKYQCSKTGAGWFPV
jgi:hypothetical protein